MGRPIFDDLGAAGERRLHQLHPGLLALTTKAPTCVGDPFQLNWTTVFDATATRVARVRTDFAQTVTLATAPTGTNTYTDTTALQGLPYECCTNAASNSDPAQIRIVAGDPSEHAGSLTWAGSAYLWKR